MKITSVNNDLIKETAKLLQKKYREKSGLFLLEGEKCIEEAISSGLKVHKIFTQESVMKFPDIEKIEVTEAIMSKISDTENIPKYIAVAQKPSYPDFNVDKFKKVLLLEGIKDAGNLGTIIRAAVAFNIDAIILYGNTVEIYNPKVVRSAVGNLWKIPVYSVEDIGFIKNNFKEYERVATLPKNESSVWLDDLKLKKDRVLLMFGSEATGLSEELINIATVSVTIKMNTLVESLNLSLSAGIIMYYTK